MAEDQVEHEFMGKSRSKVWTYLILMVLLVIIVVVVNVVWQHPDAAKDGWHTFFGLPSGVLAGIMALVGTLVFWMGLKVETDWPEAIGAFMVSAAVAWGELIVGWSKFDLGGIFVLPYLLPIVMFVLLLMYGMKRSV
jgi:hypothetical protein